MPPPIIPEPDAVGLEQPIGTLRRYAQEAGFRAVEVLPIETSTWRFYRLCP